MRSPRDSERGCASAPTRRETDSQSKAGTKKDKTGIGKTLLALLACAAGTAYAGFTTVAWLDSSCDANGEADFGCCATVGD